MSAGRKIGEPILEIDDISLAFGGVAALQAVSFDVREHEIRAIIGPNGAGKSSMLNVINGVYHPQRGSVTFKGARRHRVDPHEAARQGTYARPRSAGSPTACRSAWSSGARLPRNRNSCSSMSPWRA